MATLKSGEIEVVVEPFGPTEKFVERVRSAILKDKRVLAELRETKFRVMEVSFPESTKKLKGPAPFRSASRFNAVIYDYTNNRVLDLSGLESTPAGWAITESSRQPPPT